MMSRWINTTIIKNIKMLKQIFKKYYLKIKNNRKDKKY